MELLNAFAGIAGIVALYITWREIRRANVPNLKLLNCREFGETGIRTRGRLAAVVELAMQSTGATIYHAGLYLVLDVPDREFRTTRFSIRLRPVNANGEQAELSDWQRGMNVRFRLDSLELDPSTIEFLRGARVVRESRAQIEVRSNGFTIWRRQVPNLQDRTARHWNRFARRIDIAIEFIRRMTFRSRNAEHDLAVGAAMSRFVPRGMNVEAEIEDFMKGIRSPSHGIQIDAWNPQKARTA